MPFFSPANVDSRFHSSVGNRTCFDLSRRLLVMDVAWPRMIMIAHFVLTLGVDLLEFDSMSATKKDFNR